MARSRRRRADSSSAAGSRVAAAAYRLASASTSGGKVSTQSPASGRPLFCMTTRIWSWPSSLTSRWTVPGVNHRQSPGRSATSA